MSNMDHLIPPLKNLGLSDKEARVYLALLQLGPATPYKMSKRAHLKRPTAYVIAEELLEKGFVVQAPGEKHTYIARSPDILFDEYEKRLMQSRKSLPELKSLQGGIAEKPSILYFDGVEGVRQALAFRQKELHEKEIVGFFATTEGISADVLEVCVEWNEYKERHKTLVRGFTPDVRGLQQFKQFLDPRTSTIDARYLPKDIYHSNVSIESCGSFTRIVMFDTAQALIIDSPQTADAVRQIFEMLWSRIGDDEFNKSKFAKS